MPGEDKILITSNDSRIRLYDLRDLNVSCKYKGYVNMSSQIKASFSHDGKDQFKMFICINFILKCSKLMPCYKSDKLQDICLS